MKIGIVGGGLGGTAAAIKLAAAGHQVTIFEKNEHLGGKMNVWESEGYTFDMGPTILTLPHVLYKLFECAGRRLEDYLSLVSLDPQWRTFFQDGSQLDLYSGLEGMTRELERFAPAEMPSYLRFLAYARRMYDISERWFFWKPYGSLLDMMRANPMNSQSGVLAMQMDPLTSMHGAIHKHFRDERLAQVFEHFVQYVGSSPFIAPAILCLIPWAQISEGLHYSMGGTGAVAKALRRLCSELGVEVRTGALVEKIDVEAGCATGISLTSGETIGFDAVVANSDIVRTFRELLPDGEAAIDRAGKSLEPSCSGVVIYLGCRKKFPHLLHHNFFFSADANAEFEDLYERKLPHSDPTIYLAVPSRTDPSVAPEGCENIYILVHTPYITSAYDWSSNARGYRNIILDKLELSGLEGLRESIETERMLTPLDIESLYRVNRGSIYGVVTQRGLHSAFKTGNRSRNIRGLYFCGGSVNPGPGVPMALMSGQIAADCVLEDAQMLQTVTTRKSSRLMTGLLYGSAALAAWGVGTLAIRAIGRAKRATGEPPTAT